MKTIYRVVMMLALVVWLGGLLFFPIVAGVAFSADTNQQAAGLIVRTCLITLHDIGLACGVLMLLLLIIGHNSRALRRSVYPSMILLLVMIGLTATSQFSIIPRMETYRLATGGAISLATVSDPNRIGFERLHQTSVEMEAGVMVAGLLLVVALAWLDSGGSVERVIRNLPR